MFAKIKKLVWWHWVVLFVLLAAIGFGGYKMIIEPQRQLAAGQVSVYFLKKDSLDLVAVKREIAAGQSADSAVKLALEQLFAGTNEYEKATGLATAIRRTLKLNSVVVEDGVATIDLNEVISGQTYNADDRALVLSQISKTALNIPGIREVRVTSQGKDL